MSLGGPKLVIERIQATGVAVDGIFITFWVFASFALTFVLENLYGMPGKNSTDLRLLTVGRFCFRQRSGSNSRLLASAQRLRNSWPLLRTPWASGGSAFCTLDWMVLWMSRVRARLAS
jgi:hypothetical protein